MNVAAPLRKLSPKDYASDQEVRWCPGCGDYAILKAVEKLRREGVQVSHVHLSHIWPLPRNKGEL